MADNNSPLFFGDNPMSNKITNEDFLNIGDNSTNPYEEDGNPLLFGDTKANQEYYDKIRKEVADQIGQAQPNQSKDYFREMRKEFSNQINQLPIRDNLDFREKVSKKEEEIADLKNQLKNARDIAQKYKGKAVKKRVMTIVGATIIFITGVYSGVKGYQNKDKIQDFFTPVSTTDDNGLPSLSFLKAYANEYTEIQYEGLWYDLDYIIECAENNEKPDPKNSYNNRSQSNDISDEYAEEYKEANGYYPDGYSK